MKKLIVLGFVLISAASLAAQWPKVPDATVPHTADGKINFDAPTPRTADGKPDLSGIWMRANSAPPGRGRGGAGRAGGGAGRAGAPAAGAPAAAASPAAGAAPAAGQAAAAPTADGGNGGPAAFQPGRGGVSLEAATPPFPYDPK